MAEFAEAKEEVLREFLDLEGGPPSQDTFSRVFRMLDPAAFAACFQTYLDQLGAACRGHVAIDGKTLRGAHAPSCRSLAIAEQENWCASGGVYLGLVGDAPSWFE